MPKCYIFNKCIKYCIVFLTIGCGYFLQSILYHPSELVHTITSFENALAAFRNVFATNSTNFKSVGKFSYI